MTIVIYHNPDSEMSRNVLAIIQASGYEPSVVNYLVTGWTVPQLRGLFAVANISAKMALRASRSPADELGLLDASVSEEALLSAMVEYPILVNTPFVCAPKGVRLCRPSETVLDIMDNFPTSPFYKKDGELLIDNDETRAESAEYLDYKLEFPHGF